MNTAIENRLARKIKTLRKKKGFTQEKLSELSGIDYKHIQLLESRNPPAAKIDTVEKLAKAFRITISQLLKF